MDFTERLNLYLEGGMIQPDDVADVQAIITMFDQKYHIVLQEENADTFIAHLCAAFGRSATGEEVEPLPPEVKAELEGPGQLSAIAADAQGCYGGNAQSLKPNRTRLRAASHK